jgi:uncharacterized protein YbjT (DUF2867 family)
MMKQDLILVVGASGMVGMELVKVLKSKGHAVRTTTSKEPKDASSVQVNLATVEGLHRAFEGVTKAFFLSPPGYADQYKILSPLIQEAKRRGLQKVVLMTAMGANAVETSPFRRAEIDLEKSGLNYNIIRPNWFLQNFNTFWIQGIREQGKILLPAGEAKTSFIHAKDISEVAAKLLTSDQFARKDFDLTGPLALTHAEAAAAISNGTGRKVGYQDISPEVFRLGLLSAGLPADYVEVLVMIMGYLKEGYAERSTESVKEILGRAPLGISEYVQENKAAFL